MEKKEYILQEERKKMMTLSKSTTRLIDGHASMSRFIDSLEFDTIIYRNKIFVNNKGKKGELIATVVNTKKRKK